MYQLRKATAADTETVLSLYRDAVGRDGCTWNEYYPSAETVEEDLGFDSLYVYESDGTVIGCVSVVGENELDELDGWEHTENVKEFARITIRRDYAGQGLAAKLLAGLFEKLKGEGCEAVHILVAVGNMAAQKTYTRLGFRLFGEVEMFGHLYHCGELVL